MISPSKFYDLASGRRHGPGASCLRGALRVAELPYRSAVAWRNRRYDCGKADVHLASVPVISVGNLTVGGTGKTPMVKWIARRLLEWDVRFALLSRGYGARNGRANDEARELELDLPHVPHLQNPNRLAAAQVAVGEFHAELLLLDDGFQHRRLHRDLDIVLLDAMEPFGYGHLLPRGTLREPVAALRRANVVILSRADLVDELARRDIRAQVAEHAPDALWGEICHAPSALVNAGGERRSPQELAGRGVAAFCGIGNPAGFRATLENCGYEVIGWREFADHRTYRSSDTGALAEWCSQTGAVAAVCTQKDLVKLRLKELGGLPLWALTVETEFLDGEDGFCQKVYATVR